jgi:anti-anti-sigma regulatory factor
MPTHITQIDDAESRRTILRVDGEMTLDDAELLERIVSGMDTEYSVVIDLAELDLLDSDAASVLKRMQSEKGIQIEGVEIFLQAAVNEHERSTS